MTSKLAFKSLSLFLNSAKPLYAGTSLYAVSSMNSVGVPVFLHSEGISHNFMCSSSIQFAAGGNRRPLDSPASPACPICVASLDKLTQRGSTNREEMDDSTLCSNINRNSLPLEKVKVSQEPQAELCATGRSCVTAEDLVSVTALADWLTERLPSGSEQISQWGKLAGTKSMGNLWLELSQGEISLEDSRPPKRTVHVASVKITNGSGKRLLEAHQEMADGTIRERNRPLSEKMKPGETVEEACLRGISEELGFELGAANRVAMLQDTYTREVEERESLSYPGLMTCYVLHHMEAVIKHLPADKFVTEENESCVDTGPLESTSALSTFQGEKVAVKETVNLEKIIGVKRHFWKWVPEAFED